MKKINKMKSIILILSFLLFPVIVNAGERTSESDVELVFVLDCSQSMKEIDSQYEIPDMISGMLSALPQNCKAGIVAYNNETAFCFPVGSEKEEMIQELTQIKYQQYGNAGLGLDTALSLFKDELAEKRILMVSDGEIMMKTSEQTQEAAELFDKAVEKAEASGISIDVLALGELLEGENTIYFAAENTSGNLYKLTDMEKVSEFTGSYLFDRMGIKKRNVGSLSGAGRELTVKLPDCLMDKAQVILLGRQDNENFTVNCKALDIKIAKGKNYTIIDILKPESEEIKIQMASEDAMEVHAYLTAEYSFSLNVEHDYIPEAGTAFIYLSIQNMDGGNLLEGHMKDEKLKLYLNDKEQTYELRNGKIFLKEQVKEDKIIRLEIAARDLYGIYYGKTWVEEEILVPVPEEEPKPPIDWFFWSVITLFILALLTIFLLSKNKKSKMSKKRTMIDVSGTLPDESRIPKNDFCGKLQIYVIHNKEEIDYPPESINLFARCNREVITLEWILDACNLPFDLKGAEKVVIRPGEDKSLLIKNSGRVTAMKGRELLEKGHIYHLYYHEKVTFIFDQEDTEIEVHYKDLKPNER